MIFAHDTEVALAEAAALVNTLERRRRRALTTTPGCDRFLERYPFSGVVLGTDEELAQVRQLRERLRTTLDGAPTATRRRRSSTRSCARPTRSPT